jgi:catechol 2,3-dioxygenase-like lactoylglutathione lyase family enzyme
MTPESFFHVAIKTDDIDAAVDFYREHLDGELVDRGSAEEGSGATAVNHAALEVGDKLVYLFDRAPYEAAGMVENVPTGILHYGFVVEDVAEAAAELAAADVEFIMEPTTFGDLKIAFFTDPGDVRIELIEHL